METTSESTVLVLSRLNLTGGREAKFSGGGGGAREEPELFMAMMVKMTMGSWMYVLQGARDTGRGEKCQERKTQYLFQLSTLNTRWLGWSRPNQRPKCSWSPVAGMWWFNTAVRPRDKRAHIYSQSTKSRHWHTSNMCCRLRRTGRWEKSKVTKEMEARGFFKHAGLHALARDNNRTRPPSMAARLA